MLIKHIWCAFVLFIVFLNYEGFVKCERFTAAQVRGVFCKDCEKLKNGLVRNFLVSGFQTKTKQYRIGKTHVSNDTKFNDATLIPSLVNDENMYIYPLFNNSRWEAFSVKINGNFADIMLFQTKPKPSQKSHCIQSISLGEHSLLKSDESVLLILDNYLVVNSTHLIDITKTCDNIDNGNTFTFVPLASVTSDITADDINKCFVNPKEIQCVWNWTNKKLASYNVTKHHDKKVIYQKYGVVVWAARHNVDANHDRIAYYVYDALTGKNYWIDDYIRYSKEQYNYSVSIGHIIPLIEWSTHFYGCVLPRNVIVNI